ncbi:dihydroorotase [Marinobacter zhejiangensis]|uniref:Dihydroorotase n=1 Tax=Marinobacter zhejiangensis TaxID=488535 RepID=A0A1I4LE39_9GAMM|nr:dihydroorotase [Marinobacter zhejiangensis]SFL89116.1 dihydroorotase [Marinobacter zhejiangensis]
MSEQQTTVRIIHGRLLDAEHDGSVTASLLLQGGHIAAIGAEAELGDVDRVIDASGCLVSPGFIDLNCNLREPGNGQKGNIASETLAAARGGFSTVCASPATSPVNDSSAVTNLISDVAETQSPIRVLPLGAATRGLEGELLSDMAGLSRAGCVALSNAGAQMRNSRILRRCMAYARTFDLTLMLAPVNQALAADGYAHDGLVTSRLGLLGIPEVAETTAVMELLLLAEETGVRLHLNQLSCGRSVAMVADAQKRGVAVTADVAMHQLLFTEDALAGFDSRFHVRPPLRTEADRQGLLAGVRDGVIGAIVSQHQPHDSAAKQAPLGATEPGLSTVESVLSMGLELVNDGELSLQQLVSSLTYGPAGVLGETSALRVGQRADLCIFDPDASWQADDSSLVSIGKHAPVRHCPLKGVVRHTLCAGNEAWGPGGD